MSEPDKLMPHESDGIQEYDNPSPGWWLWTFYGGIAFAIAYMFYYGMNFGGNNHASWSEAQIRERAAVQAWWAKNPMVPPTAEDLLAAAVDPVVLERAREPWTKSCASCHGDLGQGLIGPNLTDPNWLHGGKATEIWTTIVKGVPDKGMPTWGRKFTAEDLTALAAFVRSLQGSSPPGARPPQGDPVEMEPLPGQAGAAAPAEVQAPPPAEVPAP